MNITEVSFLEKLHHASSKYKQAMSPNNSRSAAEELAHECLREVGLLHEKTTPERRHALTTVIFNDREARDGKEMGFIYPALLLARAWSLYQAP